MLRSKAPIRPGNENAPHSADPHTIYLAPRCCYSQAEPRQWCEDMVWPCRDCPDPKTARVARYVLAEQIKPGSDDPEERGEV